MAETDIPQSYMSQTVSMALSEIIFSFSKRLYRKPRYELMNYNISF